MGETERKVAPMRREKGGVAKRERFRRVLVAGGWSEGREWPRG